MQNKSISLNKILFIATVITVISFFLLLVVANATNRRGITELNNLRNETSDYSDKIAKMNVEIATFSSLKRVEERAKEMGFEKAKNIEYLK